MKMALVVALACVLSGCVNLSRGDRETLREIQHIGLGKTDERVKDPLAAGLLNILPGFGNFYLCYGTDESEQALVGLLNLLFWPFSVVWGIPEAAIDANTLNKQETVYYYTRTARGVAEFKAAQERVSEFERKIE